MGQITVKLIDEGQPVDGTVKIVAFQFDIWPLTVAEATTQGGEATLDYGFLPFRRLKVEADTLTKKGEGSFATDIASNPSINTITIEMQGGTKIIKTWEAFTGALGGYLWGIIILVIVAGIVIILVKGIPKIKIPWGRK